MPNFEFDPAQTNYTIQLPLGTSELPELTYEKGDEYQSVEKPRQPVFRFQSTSASVRSNATFPLAIHAHIRIRANPPDTLSDQSENN